jgi:hypothetical protein
MFRYFLICLAIVSPIPFYYYSLSLIVLAALCINIIVESFISTLWAIFTAASRELLEDRSFAQGTMLSGIVEMATSAMIDIISRDVIGTSMPEVTLIVMHPIKSILMLNHYKDLYYPGKLNIVMFLNNNLFALKSRLSDSFIAVNGKKTFMFFDYNNIEEEIALMFSDLKRYELDKTAYFAIYDTVLEEFALYIAVQTIMKKNADVLKGKTINSRSSMTIINSNIRSLRNRMFVYFNVYNDCYGLWDAKVLLNNNDRVDSDEVTDRKKHYHSLLDKQYKAIINNAKIVYDEHVISKSSMSFFMFMKKRMNMSKVWLDVTRDNFTSMMIGDMSLMKKIGFAIIVVYREIYSHMLLHAVPLYIVSQYKKDIDIITTMVDNMYIFIGFVGICIISTCIEVTISYLTGPKMLRWHQYLLYIPMSIIFSIAGTVFNIVSVVKSYKN